MVQSTMTEDSNSSCRSSSSKKKMDIALDSPQQPAEEEEEIGEANQTMKRQLQLQSWPSLVVLLRGPGLMGAVVLSITYSLMQQLSSTALLQLGLLGLGLGWCCYDASRLGLEQLRLVVKQTLDATVWDEVLYHFFHPDYDWTEWLRTSPVGQALWMYWLPSTQEQRVQMVQAALHMNEVEARTLLATPGCYQKYVLPTAVQRWLGDPDDTNHLGGNEITTAEQGTINYNNALRPVEDASTDKSTSSSASVGSASDASVSDSGAVMVDRDPTPPTPSSLPTSTSKIASPSPVVPTISTTLIQILQDAVQEQMQQFLPYLPSSQTLAGISGMAATGLALQLRYSPRARHIVRVMVETGSLLAISTLLASSLSLLIWKQFLQFQHCDNKEIYLIPYMRRVLQWHSQWKKVKTNHNTATMHPPMPFSRQAPTAKLGLMMAAIAVAFVGWKTKQQQQQHRR